MDFNRKDWHVFLSWFLTAHIIWLHECIKLFLVSHSCMGCPIFRSSCPEVFCRKGVLKNFTKFTGKHLCNNCTGSVTLLKKGLWHRCFPVNFVKFLRTPFFIEHLWTTASVYFTYPDHDLFQHRSIIFTRILLIVYSSSYLIIIENVRKVGKPVPWL